MKFIPVLLSVCFCCTISLLFSQNENGQNWEKQVSQTSFEIFTQKVNCQDASKGISKAYVFLKISNTSNEPLRLDYKIEKWYDGVCSNCDENNTESAYFSVELAAGENISGNCEDYRNRKLAVFSNMTGNAKARKLTNFKVIPLAFNGKKI